MAMVAVPTVSALAIAANCSVEKESHVNVNTDSAAAKTAGFSARMAPTAPTDSRVDSVNGRKMPSRLLGNRVTTAPITPARVQADTATSTSRGDIPDAAPIRSMKVHTAPSPITYTTSPAIAVHTAESARATLAA